MLWVCTVLFKEAVYPERRWDRCLDLGLRRWWGLLTAVRVKSKCGVRDLRALERAAWHRNGDSWVEKTRRPECPD